jgi:hypothetical protein
MDLAVDGEALTFYADFCHHASSFALSSLLRSKKFIIPLHYIRNKIDRFCDVSSRAAGMRNLKLGRSIENQNGLD